MTTKTTVYLDSADYRRLKAVARAQGRSPAALIRDAVAEYARRHARRRVPGTIGSARSGRGDLSERAEDLLQGMGRS
jgi:predicted transcriptional regulator